MSRSYNILVLEKLLTKCHPARCKAATLATRLHMYITAPNSRQASPRMPSNLRAFTRYYRLTHKWSCSCHIGSHAAVQVSHSLAPHLWQEKKKQQALFLLWLS